MPRTRSPLSLREAAFIRAFLTGPRGVRGCQVKAARMAGYSAKSARTMASELLLRPRVQAAMRGGGPRTEVA